MPLRRSFLPEEGALLANARGSVNWGVLRSGWIATALVLFVSGAPGLSARPSQAASKQQTGPQSSSPKPPAVEPKAVNQAPAEADVAAKRGLVDQYCVTCHNARLKTANLLLDQLDLARLGDNAAIGEKVVRKLRAGMMPPSGMRRPDAATLQSLIRWMEDELDRSAVTHVPAPGLHRLNRTEYANAIRDLLALEVDATKFLPPDDSTHGVDGGVPVGRGKNQPACDW
jgi:cytochrome c5